MSTGEWNPLSRLGDRNLIEPPLQAELVGSDRTSRLKRKQAPIIIEVVDYSVSGVGFRIPGDFIPNLKDTFTLKVNNEQVLVCVIARHETPDGPHWGASFVGPYPNTFRQLDLAGHAPGPNDSEDRWNSLRS